MFFQNSLGLCLLLISFGLVRTAPTPLLGIGNSSDNQTAATIAVSNATIDSDLVRPAEFSRIAYCSNAAVTSWNCGPPCDAVPGVRVLQSGGGKAFPTIYGVVMVC